MTMLRWSVHVLVFLYTVWPERVIGTDLDFDVDGYRQPVDIRALIQKIDRQEDRLQTLETVVSRHTTELEEKTRIIYRLEQELTDFRFRMGQVQTSFEKSSPVEEENNGKYQYESVINKTEYGHNTPTKTRPDYALYDQQVLAKPRKDETFHAQTRPDHNRTQQRTRMNVIRENLETQDVSSVTPRRRGIAPKMIDGNAKEFGLGYSGLKIKQNTEEYIRPAPRNELHRNDRAGTSSASTGGFAFSLYLHSDIHVYQNRPIIFDGVRCCNNANSFYDIETGVYQVPTSGVYVFTWSIVSAENSGGNMITELVIAGKVMGATNADSDLHNWESATGLAVVAVNKDEEVFIRAYSTGTVISRAIAKSTFSGWQLY